MKAVMPKMGLQPSNRLTDPKDAKEPKEPKNAKDTKGPKDRLTAEQVQRYKRLVAQGMSEEFARAAVRGEKADL